MTNRALLLLLLLMLLLLMMIKELFVQHLALTSFNNRSQTAANTLNYSDLAKTAEESDTFHFLTGEKPDSPETVNLQLLIISV